MNFETTKGPGGQRPQREPTGVPGFSTGTTTGPSKTASEDAAFKIPAGSRKSALVHLALAAWHAGELDPLHLGEVRGRKVDEARLQRALYRSSMGEIEHALGVP